MKKEKYNFVNKPEHIYVDETKLCKKKDCKNVHLFLNKRLGTDNYAFSFSFSRSWAYGTWSQQPKEICVKEEGWIKEFTSKLEDRDFLEVSTDLLNEIFGDYNYKDNWQLFTF